MLKLYFLKSKLIYLICLVLFSYSNHAQKSLRIGYVDMDYILENLNDYKTANEEYEIRLDKWKKEISQRDLTQYFPEMVYGILLKKGKIIDGLLKQFIHLITTEKLLNAHKL